MGNAAQNTEVVGRKIKSLDEVSSKCKQRHSNAVENLQRMRNSLAEKQKHIEFMQKSRDELYEKIEADRQKAKELRSNLRKTEKQFKDVVNSIQDQAKFVLHGKGDVKGLRQVHGQAISRDLEVLRGYSTAPGTTPGPSGQAGNSLGTMRLRR